MSMNRYGVIAQRHWARWLPKQYAAISDPDTFFTTLREEVARQIDAVADELMDETGQGDGYLAQVGWLFAARAVAGELILPQRVLPEPNWPQTTTKTRRTSCRWGAGSGRWSWTATAGHGRRWTSSTNASTVQRQETQRVPPTPSGC